MLVELLLLSLVGCAGGALLLFGVVRTTQHRWLNVFVANSGLVLGVLLVVCGALLEQRMGAIWRGLTVGSEALDFVWGVQSGLFGVVMVHPHWQYGTLLAALVPVSVFLMLTVVKPSKRIVGAVFGLGTLLMAGLLFVLTSSFLIMFVAFELLLLVSLYLLRLTAKSDRVVEAVTEMFFWTLVGSVGLFIGTSLLLIGGVSTIGQAVWVQSTPTLGVLALCLGFGVKLPVWPCFSWLLKAHVEASVEFSILLSGIVVKFGALGLYRALALQDSILGGELLAACSTIAILEASLRLLAQRDLKRIVALTTVIEVNWVGVCIGLGGSTFERVGVLVLVAHSLTTTAEFYIVECLYRRYGTRDVVSLCGVAVSTPLLFGCTFLNLLTTLGFPGTSLFAAKLLFLTSLLQYSGFLFCLFAGVLVLWLPVCFMRIWVPIWYGQCRTSTLVPDVFAREVALLLLCVGASIWLGLWPSVVLISL